MARIGTATSYGRPTSVPKKPGGSTPTIVNGTALSCTVEPRTSALPPKRRIQNP